MSRLNLRAAFALGLDSPISAQRIFTNRASEIGAFDKSVEALASRLEEAEVSPVTDRRVPRRNVLVYYGVGGHREDDALGRESHYIGLYHQLLVDRRPLMPSEQSSLLHSVLLRD